MTYNKPLTLEEQQFAEENHNLINSFLRFKRLNADYYDVVVFGYLRAVRKYFERPELRQYKFITIAYAAMNTDLGNHYRKQNRQKRKAYIISFDTPIYEDNESLTLVDIIPAGDIAANYMACGLLEEIEAALPKEQIKILRMKSEGYTDREIAGLNEVPVRSVQEVISAIRELLYPKLV